MKSINRIVAVLLVLCLIGDLAVAGDRWPAGHGPRVTDHVFSSQALAPTMAFATTPSLRKETSAKVDRSLASAMRSPTGNEVFDRMARGFRTRDIAQSLEITIRKVRMNLSDAYERLQLRDPLQDPQGKKLGRGAVLRSVYQRGYPLPPDEIITPLLNLCRSKELSKLEKMILTCAITGHTTYKAIALALPPREKKYAIEEAITSINAKLTKHFGPNPIDFWLAAALLAAPRDGKALDPDILYAPAGREDILGVLTPRQREAVELMIQGLERKDISSRLGICIGTVRVHLTDAYKRLRVKGYGIRAVMKASNPDDRAGAVLTFLRQSSGQDIMEYTLILGAFSAVVGILFTRLQPGALGPAHLHLVSLYQIAIAATVAVNSLVFGMAAGENDPPDAWSAEPVQRLLEALRSGAIDWPQNILRPLIEKKDVEAFFDALSAEPVEQIDNSLEGQLLVERPMPNAGRILRIESVASDGTVNALTLITWVKKNSNVVFGNNTEVQKYAPGELLNPKVRLLPGLRIAAVNPDPQVLRLIADMHALTEPWKKMGFLKPTDGDEFLYGDDPENGAMLSASRKGYWVMRLPINPAFGSRFLWISFNIGTKTFLVNCVRPQPFDCAKDPFRRLVSVGPNKLRIVLVKDAFEAIQEEVRHGKYGDFEWEIVAEEDEPGPPHEGPRLVKPSAAPDGMQNHTIATTPEYHRPGRRSIEPGEDHLRRFADTRRRLRKDHGKLLADVLDEVKTTLAQFLNVLAHFENGVIVQDLLAHKNPVVDLITTYHESLHAKLYRRRRARTVTEAEKLAEEIAVTYKELEYFFSSKFKPDERTTFEGFLTGQRQDIVSHLYLALLRDLRRYVNWTRDHVAVLGLVSNYVRPGAADDQTLQALANRYIKQLAPQDSAAGAERENLNRQRRLAGIALNKQPVKAKEELQEALQRAEQGQRFVVPPMLVKLGIQRGDTVNGFLDWLQKLVTRWWIEICPDRPLPPDGLFWNLTKHLLKPGWKRLINGKPPARDPKLAEDEVVELIPPKTPQPARPRKAKPAIAIEGLPDSLSEEVNIIAALLNDCSVKKRRAWVTKISLKVGNFRSVLNQELRSSNSNLVLKEPIVILNAMMSILHRGIWSPFVFYPRVNELRDHMRSLIESLKQIPPKKSDSQASARRDQGAA